MNCATDVSDILLYQRLSLCCPESQPVLCTLCGIWIKLRNLIQQPQTVITMRLTCKVQLADV